MNTLIVSELAIAHVAMVLDDFADVFRGQILQRE
jgi:hypothetical protein